jgi:hypothetical protein
MELAARIFMFKTLWLVRIGNMSLVMMPINQLPDILIAAPLR